MNSVVPSPKIAEAFKRDSVFKESFDGKGIQLMGTSSPWAFFPISHLKKLTTLLERMINNQLPPSDQELYEKAIQLASSNSSADVEQAKKTFESISDYMDSAKQAENASNRYSEVLLAERKKAAEKKKRKTIGVAIAAAILFVFIIVATSIAHSNAIKNIPNVEKNLDTCYSCNEWINTYRYYEVIKLDKSTHTLTYFRRDGKNPSTNRDNATYKYTVGVRGLSHVIEAGPYLFKIEAGCKSLKDGNLILPSGYKFP